MHSRIFLLYNVYENNIKIKVVLTQNEHLNKQNNCFDRLNHSFSLSKCPKCRFCMTKHNYVGQKNTKNLRCLDRQNKYFAGKNWFVWKYSCFVCQDSITVNIVLNDKMSILYTIFLLDKTFVLSTKIEVLSYKEMVLYEKMMILLDKRITKILVFRWMKQLFWQMKLCLNTQRNHFVRWNHVFCLSKQIICLMK